MKRTVYLEIDEAYIPIFKSCGMMLSYDQFEELIRCKDCKYFTDEGWTECPMIHPTGEDDYCSYGERRDR